MKRTFFSAYTKTAALTLLALALSACMDLKLQVGDAVNKDENFSSEQDFTVALIPVYQILQSTISLPQFQLAELSSDELMVPTRGANWYDGGQFVQMYQHTWDAQAPMFEDAWQELYIGVARANKVLNELNNFPGNFPSKARIRAELRCLRAYFNFRLMDYYGSVPLMTGHDFDPYNQLAQSSRATLFFDIENDLLNALGDLPVAGDYGRFSQGAAYALLAKLYLNAEVYVNQPRYADCQLACDAVINSGQYSLVPAYFDNFVHDNDQIAQDEILLAAVFDPDVLPGIGNNLHMRTLNYGAQTQFNLQSQPWNGYCTAADFYNSFDNNDVRKTAFLVGPQLNPDNSPVIDPLTGMAVNYTPAIVDINNATNNAGIRVLKYPLQGGESPNLQADAPILRYADVLLMKAEAAIRLGDQNQALALVNMVRVRSGLAPQPFITLSDILAERGRELFWETWRRNDMIRFGVFCNARDQKPATIDCNIRGLYPVPLRQMNVNPLLIQNPGY